jgi:hypothetical protein
VRWDVRLRRFSRVLALAAVGLFGFVVIREIAGSFSTEVFVFGVILLFGAVGAAVAWMDDFTGGFALLGAGAALGVFVPFAAERNDLAATLLFAAPFATAGALLLAAGWLRPSPRQ